MRFDIIGTNHNSISTPHLHLFNNNQSLMNQTILDESELPELLKNSLKDLNNIIEIFTSFLIFINVDLADIQIITDQS